MKKKKVKINRNEIVVISIVIVLILILLLIIKIYPESKRFSPGEGGTNIDFIPPTPENNYITNQQDFTISISSSDTIPSSGEHSTLLDFDDSLYAWYRFSTSSDFVDHSSHNNDGVNTGTTWSTLSTKRGTGARFFDGGPTLIGNNYIKIGNGNQNEYEDVCINGCTFSAFVYPQAVHGTIIGRSDNTGGNEFFLLGIDGSGRSNFHVSDSGLTRNCQIILSGSNPTLNAWHHIAGVYDSVTDEIKLYQDGFLKQTLKCPYTSIKATGIDSWSDSEDTLIGMHDDGSLRNEFGGLIDEVLVFSRALSDNEIKSIYDARTTQYSKTFSNVQNGVYNYKGYVIDKDGNLASEARTLTIDTGYNPSDCGNLIIEPGEDCETGDLNGQTCLTKGYDGGTLNCYAPSTPTKCKFDTSACYNNPTCTDNDGDGYGNPGDASCLNGASTDCNDNNNKIYPNAPEICDGLDNQCPGNSGYGQIDEGGVCIVDPNLVLHLKFENNFDDSSSYNNDANCPDPVNCPPSTVGGDGSGASDYRGVVSALTVPKSTSLDFGTGSFSTSSWIKVRTADNSGGERIINNRGQGGLSYTGWQFKIKQGTGGWGFYDSLIVESNDYLGCNSAFCGTGVWSYNNWHHVVLTFDNTNDIMKIYVDGVLTYTDTSVANGGGGNGAIGNINNNLDTIIGASFYNSGVKLSSPQQLLDGIVDEVKVYNKVLTSSEITTLKNQYNLPICSNSIIEGDETCDDGDTQSGDGCSSSCQIESGWTCTGEPSICTPIQAAVCGNGDVQIGEGCDDVPPAESGDGCSLVCQIEPGYTCVGEPSICSIITGNAPYVGHSEVDNTQLYNDWVVNNPGCLTLLKSKKIIIGGRSWMQNVVNGLKREGYDMSAQSYPTGDQHRPYNGASEDIPENIFSIRKHVLYMSIVSPLNKRPIEFRSFFDSGESFTYGSGYTTNHDFSDDGLAMAMLESRSDILASPEDPASMYNQYVSINSQLQANNPSIKFVYTTQMAYGYIKDDNEAAEIYNKNYMIPNQKGKVPIYDYHDITTTLPNSNTKCSAGGNEIMCSQYSADGGTHPSSETGERRLGKGLLLLMAQMYCDNPYT